MTRARRDTWKALLLQLMGIAATAAAAGLIWLGSARGFRPVMVLGLVAIFGLGRGTWLLFDARRRLRVANARRLPAPARVLRRARES